jgi:hypothetical protein
LHLEYHDAYERTDDQEDGNQPHDARHASAVLRGITQVLPFDVVWLASFDYLWPSLEKMQLLYLLLLVWTATIEATCLEFSLKPSHVVSFLHHFLTLHVSKHDECIPDIVL